MLAVDEVADASDALAEDHAWRRGVEADGDWPLMVDGVGQPAHNASEQSAVEGDAAFRNAGDDPGQVAAELVPVFKHEEHARPDDGARHADEGDLLPNLRGDAILLRQPNG